MTIFTPTLTPHRNNTGDVLSTTAKTAAKTPSVLETVGPKLGNSHISAQDRSGPSDQLDGSAPRDGRSAPRDASTTTPTTTTPLQRPMRDERAVHERWPKVSVAELERLDQSTWPQIYEGLERLDAAWHHGDGTPRSLGTHRGAVWDTAPGPFDVVTTSAAGELLRWDIETGDLINTLKGHTAPVTCMLRRDQQLITGSDDNTLRVWDLTAGTSVVLPGHQASVNAIAMCESSGRLFSASDDNSVKVWRMAEHDCIKTLRGHIAPVHALLVAPDLIASGANDGRIVVWNAKDLSRRFSLKSHTGAVFGLYRDGDMLFSAGVDGSLHRTNLVSGRAERELVGGHTGPILFVDGEGSTVVTGGRDGRVCVWDTISGSLVRTLQHAAPIAGVSLRDGLLVTASIDGITKLWDLPSGGCLRTDNLGQGECPPRLSTFNLIRGTESGTVSVVDFATTHTTNEQTRRD